MIAKLLAPFRRHPIPCRCACFVHGYFEAAREAKLRDDTERALRNVRLSDAQMHDLVVLRERRQRGEI